MISNGVDKINNITLALFYIVICMLILFESNVFAAPSVFEVIKQVEAQDKPVPDEFIQRPNMTYNASDLRDPFQTYIVEEEPEDIARETPNVFQGREAEKRAPSLIIQGIVWGGNFPQAIINNKVVKRGETIEGAFIKEIDKEGVTLIFEGRKYKLPVSALKNSPENKSTFPGGEYEKRF